MIKYPSDNQEAHKPMGLWACEPVNLTKTPIYPKIPDPPIVAAGLLGPDLVLMRKERAGSLFTAKREDDVSPDVQGCNKKGSSQVV